MSIPVQSRANAWVVFSVADRHPVILALADGQRPMRPWFGRITERLDWRRSNYWNLGMLGYGTQIAALLWTATFTSLNLPLVYNLQGFNLGTIAVVPGFLTSLAWLYAGKDRNSGLYKATGVVGLVASTAGILSAIWFALLGSLPSASAGAASFLRAAFAFLAIGALVGVLAFTQFIFETISFFSAGRLLQSRRFRYAGWSRIFVVVGATVIFIVAFLYGFLTLLSSATPGGPVPAMAALRASPTPTDEFRRIIALATAGVYLIATVPDFFAFFGFREIKRRGPPATTVASSAAVTGSPTQLAKVGTHGVNLARVIRISINRLIRVVVEGQSGRGFACGVGINARTLEDERLQHAQLLLR